MVNMRFRKLSAALCASLILACGADVQAEEKHIGDLIYVPAMTVEAQAGTYTLRVEGIALTAEGDEPVSQGQIAGAEFGVYVVSSTGEVKPWANPLYPSAPMRIRTGEGETRFSLPAGTEFFLRQESAPEGYRFDGEALIPVSGSEIVVTNSMAGQLVITAADTLGVPVAGAEFVVTAEDGAQQVLTTDKNGEAVLVCQQAGVYDVVESAVPDGVFDAIAVNPVRESDFVRRDALGIAVRVSDASRTRVVFEHPASGTVQLNVALEVIDDNADKTLFPLEGVRMDVFSQRPVSLVTDMTGSVQTTMLEGDYYVRLSYDGEALLPYGEGTVIVQSGATTLIEMTAVQPTGRISVEMLSSKQLTGGSMTIVSDGTGETFGPLAVDADGFAVSAPLEPGMYHVSLTAPEAAQIGEVSCADVSVSGNEELVVRVEAGQVASVQAEMLTMEKQTYAVLTEQVNEAGETEETLLTALDHVQLVDANGAGVMDLTLQSGSVTVEALSGTYTLRMEEKTAAQLGVQAQSAPFVLPSEAESVAFASTSTRLVLTSVDENGAPIAGDLYAQDGMAAVYSVEDALGARYEVTADELGEAVTPPLSFGDVRVTTIQPPYLYDEADETVVYANGGEAAHVQLVHEHYGTASIVTQQQKLDERGEAAYSALTDAHVEILRAQDQSLVAELTTGEDGRVSIALEAGEYIALLDAEGVSATFTVANTEKTEVQLTGYGDMGGLLVELTGGELTDAQLAQVRFELAAQDGSVTAISLKQGAFYAGNLPEGAYTLRQTQMPEGYTLGEAYAVTVEGGRLSKQDVPLEEYAVLCVNKSGLTFNDRLQTFIVPLTGEFAVYTQEDGRMEPYPSAEAQVTVWSNITPEQAAQGRAAQIKLPAKLGGTTYYLKEAAAAPGFAQDETYHEIVLKAGEAFTFESAASTDRGFFALEQLDAVTGAHVGGGLYELLDEETLEPVLEFEMSEAAYRNAMAIGVGRYILRQTKAAPGYAMSIDAQQYIEIEPYLTQGGTVTQVAMHSAQIPQSERMDAIADFYAAQEQGLLLLCVDGKAIGAGETLTVPQMTLTISAENAQRSDIRSVLLDSTTDVTGAEYTARVEYCLTEGGWQPSDARMSPVLSAPVAVSLSDVEDDISAVRITYINTHTGKEIAGEGFNPGRVTLDVRVNGDDVVPIQAQATFTGVFAYTQELFGERRIMKREAVSNIAFEAQGSGAFDAAPAGRDGQVTGVAFLDENADGVMDEEETSRFAGMNVYLLNAAGDTVATTRTDGNGAYRFDALSAGEYTVQFDAGEQVVFSHGELYSEHLVSGVADIHYGESAQLRIDAEHTDYVVHAGCLYAAAVTGSVVETLADGVQAGYGGLVIELYRRDDGGNEEPLVVVTDEMGGFSIGGLLPGQYELRMNVPEAYLCKGAADGIVAHEMELWQGRQADVGPFWLERSACVSGSVRIDDDGDGVIADDAQALSGAVVKLLEVRDGHTQSVMQTQTNEEGAYAFENVPSGVYSVLFELDGEWAFTRYGEDSLVYGAATASGSTEHIAVEPGADIQNIDAGVTIPAALSVSVFRDEQLDGQKGVYEKMLAGVEISLIRLEDGSDAQEMTATTGEDGVVAFERVSPGEYVIAYRMPDAWRTTKQVDPQSANYPVSCVPQSTLSAGRSQPFTLGMGQKDAKLYIGAMLSGSISGTVYYDDNADAKLGEQESLVADVLVELLDAQGNVVASMYTNEDGNYAFEGLAPGRYRVRFSAEAGCGFAATERTMVRGGVQESDENVAQTRAITVESGTAIETADAGVVRLSTISGVIWEDRDADRARDEEEALLPGVEVALMNGSGRNILRTAVTDEHGVFTFSNMRPGEYMLRVGAPEGYVFSGELATGLLSVQEVRDRRAYSYTFALLGGVRVDNIGYGLYTQGTISGRLWQDADFDAVMAESEEGLRGAVLTLLDESGETAAKLTSQRSGEFAFEGLMPGAYTLHVELGEGYVFTRVQGESLIEETGKHTAQLDLGTLGMGETIEGINIGALKPAVVGGVIWYDGDDDGRRQVDDQGMTNLIVTLTSEEDGSSYIAMTDEKGGYRFEDVLPGAYRLAYTLPDGYAFSKNASGNRRVSTVERIDALETQSETFAVASGEQLLDRDVGVVGVGTVSGVIWEDQAYSGKYAERGVAGAKIELVDVKTGETAVTTVSGEDGSYLLDFVRTGEYQLRVTLPDGMIFTRSGESVIADVDAASGVSASFALKMGESRDALHVGAIVPAVVSGSLYVDENESGAQDDGDTGLEGAVVTMMQGGTVVAACETNAQGEYLFNTIRPGTYRVRVTLPEATLFVLDSALTLENQDALEGETGSFDLTMGQTATIMPFGTVRAGAISGYAWKDDDADGLRGGAEPALAGTKAELLSFDSQGNGRIVGAVTVDESGAYAFDLLRSGTYAVRFTLPEGMLFADCLGVAGGSSVEVVPGVIGMTPFMTLKMGQRIGSVHVGGILPGAIGDSVWLDVDGNGLQDYREPLIPGVVLSLTRVERDGTAEVIAQTVSDQYGYYHFKDLRPGTYVVRAELEEGDTLTYSFGAPLGEIDSDLDPETGMSAEIALQSGVTLRNIDVGFTEKAN